MQQSLEKLRKFFRLEHENGYQNTAIIGGLAKMLDYWEGEARADELKEEVIQAVVQRLRSYDGLSPQSRADALKGLWKRIGDTYPDTQQKTSPPKSPRQAGDLINRLSLRRETINKVVRLHRPPHVGGLQGGNRARLPSRVLKPSQAQRPLPRPPRWMPS